VLVTGGSRGIGRAIALAFAAEGADVAICGRDRARLAQAEPEIAALGVTSLSIQADLFRADDCRRAVDETAEAFGRFDVLVNNASTNIGGTIETASDEQLLERVMGKTLASMRTSRAALPHFRKVGGGRIICIGGTSVRMPGKASLPSGLGNSSVVNFARHLSDAVAREGILVNVVHPPFTKTDRYPDRLAARARERGISLEQAEASFAEEFAINRVVEPGDIAPMVVFLASPWASAITGQSIVVDGGHSPAIAY
jgi:NAD(P)-dependent dehydrogenase (short-subunit alcohol dehydrogenase family)